MHALRALGGPLSAFIRSRVRRIFFQQMGSAGVHVVPEKETEKPATIGLLKWGHGDHF